MIKQITLFLTCLALTFSAFSTGINPFQGNARSGAVSFVINNVAYVGLGNNSDSVMRTFKKYDPAVGEWEAAATFPGTARTEAVAFVIGEKAYVGLGRSKYPFSYYSDFYEYNPQSNEWTQIADFGGSANYNAVAFASTEFGFVGTGRNADGDTNAFWKYNPQENTWTQVANVNGGARNGAVAFFINGKGYVSGGQSITTYTTVYSDVQEYNPETNTWTERIFADGINLSFYNASAIVVGNMAFICYGNKTQVTQYNPANNTKVSLGDVLNLSASRNDPVTFFLNNKAYFGLGYHGYPEVYPSEILELNVGQTAINYDAETMLKIYPNPSTGKFTIDLMDYNYNDAQVTVINSLGQQVFKTEASSNSTSIEVDLTGMAKGIYFVIVKNNDQETTRKIIVQ